MQNRIEMLRIFCAAVDAGGFKEAAVRLEISPQAVTRAVHEAERITGEVLFQRNTRRVKATQAGITFSEKARELVLQVDDLLRENAEAAPMSGLVRITAPKSLGQRYLMPALLKLAETHSDITIDLRLTDVIVDPISEQIDVGIRIGFMHDSRFVVKEAARVNFLLAAAPRLLERKGHPKSLAALRQMPATGLLDRRTGRIWPWILRDELQVTPSLIAFRTDDAEAECQAVAAGMGVGQLVSYLALPLLENGELVSILDELAPEPWPVYVFRPQRGPVPARVRAVFDTLVDVLRDATLS